LRAVVVDMADPTLVHAVVALGERLAGQTVAAVGEAVIAAAETDDDAAAKAPPEGPVLPCHLHRGVVGGTTRGGEQDPAVVVLAADLQESPGRLDGGTVATPEQAQVGVVDQGPPHRLGDALVPIAQVG